MSATQYIKGSSCKLQRPNQRHQLHVALGRKMQPQNDQNSGVTIKRGGEGKNWEVMVSQEFWNDSNSRKDVQLVDSQQKATSSVHFPPIRNRDESNLVNNTEKGKAQGSHPTLWNQSSVIASGLSAFTGSAKFNSSRLDTCQIFRGDGSTSQQSCRICSGVGDPGIEYELEHRPNSTVFPDETDILLERADTWQDRLPPVNLPLITVPKPIKPRDQGWKSFKPEFTKPFTYSYFSNTTQKWLKYYINIIVIIMLYIIISVCTTRAWQW